MKDYTELKIIKRGATGTGILVEQDSGIIDPTDRRNQSFINEIHNIESGKLAIVEPLVVYVILQKYGILNRNGRVYPEAILKKQNELYQQAIRERRAVGECVPAGTEIMTKDGWRMIENMVSGDEVFTLNTKTNEIQIQPVVSTIEKEYKDDMVHIFNANTLDMMLTKNHKVALWDRYGVYYELTAEELYNNLKNKDSKTSHSRINYGGIWNGVNDEYFNLPNTDLNIKIEDWAAFLGIFIAEGHTSGSCGGNITSRVTITQTKEKQKELLISLLDRLPFKYTISDDRQFNIYDKDLHNHLYVLGNSYEKHIPDYAKNWSKNILNILLEWLLVGNGRNRHNSKGELMREYYTTSNKLAQDVFEIFLKLGSGASISNRKQKDRFINDLVLVETEVDNGDGSISLVKEKIKQKRLIKADNSKLLYVISEKTSASVTLDSRYTKCELIPFNDNVYCVSTPNKTWLMRYNNKTAWTHNCDHPESSVIAADRISHNIIETWWEGHTLMGKMEVLMSPGFIKLGIVSTKGDEVANLLRNRIKIGVSSRGVGSLKEGKNGEQIVQDDFEIICWDVVTAPSTPDAWIFKNKEESKPYVENTEIKKPIIKETFNDNLDKFLLD